jgi:low affinity Fe/Cu permease
MPPSRPSTPTEQPDHEVGATRGETLRHPADRGETDTRGTFDHLAERASFLASSPIFFALCGVVVAVWVIGLALGANDRFVAAGAGLMSAVTLMLVALLKNAELRAERAIQRKLDAIARALLEQQHGDRASSSRELEDTIGVHEQI